MLEARVVLAALLARHDFRLAPGHVVDTDVHATLCPRDGMPMIFTPAGAPTPHGGEAEV